MAAPVSDKGTAMSHAQILYSYLAAGLSIIPILRDGSKMPAVEWKCYQQRQATQAEIDRWVSGGCEGWGLVCGGVSGNVEAIDFDDPTVYAPWAEQIDGDLLARLVMAETPSGGRHVIYRCAEIAGNQKLARREKDDGTVETTIETRGEGGMILVAPTTAAYHAEGKPYVITQGDLVAIPEIAPDERAALLTAARLLNEYIPQAQTYRETPGDNGHNGDGWLRPGDDFAEHTEWSEILEPAGWHVLKQRGDRIIWQRPGKDGPGGSAQTGGKSPKTGFAGLYVYSTNALPLEADRGYGKFSAYATLYHGGDYRAAAKELADDGWGAQLIIRPKATPEPETATTCADAAAEFLAENDHIAPPLPDVAYIDPILGKSASAWLNAYATLSRQWSPRAYDDFHLACALWLLSTVAARRVVLHLGGTRYSNLYIALVARTSLWAKSTTAKIVTQTLAQCGLSYLLAPDDSTPQRFISDLVLRVPGDWDRLGGMERHYAEMRMAFPASRGWFYEELGQKIDAMLAPNGFMSEFRGILRAFDDCPETYQYASIGRGLDAVKTPYVAMLGNMTPADLRRATKKNDGLWQDGFWARWAFVTPPASVNSSRARFPDGERTIPDVISDPIKTWHEALGVPTVDIDERRDGDGKASGAYDVQVGPMRRTEVHIDADAKEAFYTYHDGLLDVCERSTNRDLDGNYARFAEKALRVAMLVAALEHDNQLTFPVWALAQSIAERWRQSLHELYAQSHEAEPSENIAHEEKALEIVAKLGNPTANEVRRYMWGMTNAEVSMILDGLVHAGALLRVAQTRRGVMRYEVAP